MSVPTKPKVVHIDKWNNTVIETLREMLTAAEAGELEQVVVAASLKGNVVQTLQNCKSLYEYGVLVAFLQGNLSRKITLNTLADEGYIILRDPK